MKDLKFWQILIGILIGAIIVYLLCCRHTPDDHRHKTHTFKIWKGYVEPDTLSTSEFAGLTKVKFLNESYYFENADKEVPRSIVYVQTVKNVSVRNLPFNKKQTVKSSEDKEKSSESESENEVIDMLFIVNIDCLDKELEFFSEHSTGRIACIPPKSTNMTRIVADDTRDNKEVKLLSTLGYIHQDTGKPLPRWVYLEFTPQEYKRYLEKSASNNDCTLLMIDNSPVVHLYREKGELEVYENPRF